MRATQEHAHFPKFIYFFYLFAPDLLDLRLRFELGFASNYALSVNTWVYRVLKWACHVGCKTAHVTFTHTVFLLPACLDHVILRPWTSLHFYSALINSVLHLYVS